MAPSCLFLTGKGGRMVCTSLGCSAERPIMLARSVARSCAAPFGARGCAFITKMKTMEAAATKLQATLPDELKGLAAQGVRTEPQSGTPQKLKKASLLELFSGPSRRRGDQTAACWVIAHV